ncbi:MAG: imidazole glycerol phosphate synthase subunit HisF [Candidatus Magasanikbacteria bacterium RIFCSPHIGHO2_01_FULL_41_23]|uniref:imidazole glycerol-phosphate synthase n=1 Tax=Candidatus Magasanikbacteria bacterium RIFCSPLOWO2_01_FULL_40_15 TaxID=1798686 RepID=A0A1F6N3P6_9BACT|nr:MAG: imidazole glycerol phosphate synthase subunit HisF [Candidatus Magasanikbacteria bacterium RIFCSPHIGHO2_01_FULL_41_23]OGH76628.1 MAG: imidazole glycerol phosphate synthase subunit HisF [Candidatus Magasanikbacteria bacterium RIFCSPHIGHO2_12_FULL_41_16]OGH78539.1 MAG: imidazole glycerol phosphate synthase subunit HisF [Candidatus Magasanikbacteria bacterium RIFCSPLOWO2_01_FULL_40_15]
MLKRRIIPTLLLQNGRMIKTVNFAAFRDVGDPITAARVYNDMRADELIFLDITASTEAREALSTVITQVAEECFMPLAVGGGIRTVEDIRRTISSGADKVIINTAALENPDFIDMAVARFGSSTIVVSIDVRYNDQHEPIVFSHRGSQDTGRSAIAWAQEVTNRGAGEIMITSIEHEGTMKGLDFDLTATIIESVNVPVIAHGGVGSLADFKKAYDLGAMAVAAGSIFHFTDQSPIMTRNYLYNNGVVVRP